MRKHGIDKFKFNIIYSSLDSEYTLKVMESHFIKEFDTYINGYNCTHGGEGRLGFSHSIETKNKLSILTTKRNICNWKLTSINGNEYIVSNLKAWCNKQDIKYTTLFMNKKMPNYGIAKVEKVS